LGLARNHSSRRLLDPEGQRQQQQLVRA